MANIHLTDFQTQYDGRCKKCFMRSEKCICSLIPVIENKTRLTVLMHFKEAYKTTNTARLAHLCLKNSEVLIRGLPQQKIDFSKILQPDHEVLFLTLHEKSQILSPELIQGLKKPVQLIVPDGTWSQVARVGKREPALQNSIWVQLPAGPPSGYKLRHEHHEEGLSTLEAIARCFGAIESLQIQKQLEDVFYEMVQRTLETRPQNRF